MTAHIEALKEEIAKTVIMPGDPLRAKFIAETYLENPELVNKVRNIFAYTGNYKGKKVTVMASGMGIPSMGIYSYELFKFYDVESIIRVGSCGAYTEDLNLFDLVVATESFSKSSYCKIQNGSKKKTIKADYLLNTKILEAAESLNKKITAGKIHCSDVFYKENNNFTKLAKKGILAVEMESFALFHNANLFGKKAACLLTVSDNLVTKKETTSAERQTAFKDMIEVALESLV